MCLWIGGFGMAGWVVAVVVSEFSGVSLCHDNKMKSPMVKVDHLIGFTSLVGERGNQNFVYKRAQC